MGKIGELIVALGADNKDLKKGMKGYLRDGETVYLDCDNRLARYGFILNTFVDGNEYIPYCAGELRYEIIEGEL